MDARDKHLYWCTRSSDLLIRGGTNYSCEAISHAVSELIQERFSISKDAFSVATIGLKIWSEYDDDCCVTVELDTDVDLHTKNEIERQLLQITGESKKTVERDETYVREAGKYSSKFQRRAASSDTSG